MLKEKFSVFRRLMMCVDLLIAAGIYLISWFIADKATYVGSLEDYFIHLPFYLLLWALMLRLVRVYDSFRVKDTFDVFLSLVEASFFCVAFLGSYLYLFRIKTVSPLFMLVVLLTTTALLYIEKYILILFFRYVRSKGYNYRVLLIVGTGKRAVQFIDHIRAHKEWGFKILGLIDKDKQKAGLEINGIKIIGSFGDVPAILHRNVVDQIMFIVPRAWLGEIETVLKFCEIEGYKIGIAVDYFEHKLAKAKSEDLGGFPFLTLESTPDKTLQLLIKNIFDVLISGVVLVVLLPVFIVIAALIKLSSPGPVLFQQTRCSMNGRTFMLKKFRTMAVDAESKLDTLRAQNEMDGPAFKMEYDPRVTKVGRLLRKFSLDELPQLWNVFRGDMSVVGPRPPLPGEVEQYDNWQRRRLSMRPGLTCLWQANGRSKIKDFDEWMRLDLKYIDNWSLMLDAKIFLKTIPVVLFGIGAK